MNIGLDLRDIQIAAEDRRIGVHAVRPAVEQRLLTAGVRIRKGLVVILDRVFVLRLVVVERIRPCLEILQIIGVAVHRTGEVLLDAFLHILQLDKRNGCRFAEFLRRIISAERLPVVVGAEEDIFVGMLLQCRKYVDIDDLIQRVCDIDDAVMLVGIIRGQILRAVECRGKRHAHVVDIDLVADHCLVVIQHARVLSADIVDAAEHRHGAHLRRTLAGNDDRLIDDLALIGDLGALLGLHRLGLRGLRFGLGHGCIAADCGFRNRCGTGNGGRGSSCCCVLSAAGIDRDGIALISF